MKTTRLSTSKPRLQVAVAPRRLGVATVASRRTTGRTLQAQRLRLWLDRGQCCAECGRFVEHPHGYQLDHVIPLALGGTDTDENKQLLCWWLEDGQAKGCHVDKTRSDGSHG